MYYLWENSCFVDRKKMKINWFVYLHRYNKKKFESMLNLNKKNEEAIHNLIETRIQKSMYTNHKKNYYIESEIKLIHLYV